MFLFQFVGFVQVKNLKQLQTDSYSLRTGSALGSLSTRVVETRTATESELFSLFNFSPHNHIHIAKNLFSIRYEKYKKLGDNTVLAHEMFSSGCRPRLKNAGAYCSPFLS